MTENRLIIYKSNNLTESAYKLTLNEQRVLLSCIGQINSNEPLTANDKFELTAKDFAIMFGTDEKTAYRELIEVAKSLHNRKLTIEDNRLKITTSWISGFAEYKDNAGIISLWFAQPLLPYLSEFKSQFTRYDLANISGMTSIYGIRLYELLMQWQSKGKREIEIAWLKKQFEIADSYSSIKDLKKYVVEPAITNINRHSNLTVTHAYKKTGRSVTHVIFEFKEKVVKETAQSNLTKNKSSEKIPVDNLEYFAQIRKRFGNSAPIPPEYEAELKRLERW